MVGSVLCCSLGQREARCKTSLFSSLDLFVSIATHITSEDKKKEHVRDGGARCQNNLTGKGDEHQQKQRIMLQARYWYMKNMGEHYFMQSRKYQSMCVVFFLTLNPIFGWLDVVEFIAIVILFGSSLKPLDSLLYDLMWLSHTFR